MISEDPMPDEVREWMVDYIKSVRWREAKSGPPHSYTVREWDPQEEMFEAAVNVIRRFGHPERFWRATYLYLTLDGLKYWTMGAPLGETIIINRAEASTQYGNNVTPIKST